jgi:hypothetical protein
VANAYLDAGNVRARILNNGGLFWRGNPNVYEVPKGEGVHSVYNASIWVGGLVEGTVRMAGSTFGPYEFWPGPFSEDGRPPPDCAPFDRIYEINRDDLAHLNEQGELTTNLAAWPWHIGAPVLDGDGDPDNYTPEGSDRPELLGHQTLWWVMNDLGNTHERSNALPLGLEVQGSAYAFAVGGHVGNTTFYRYRLIYKGKDPLEAAYFSLFMDMDLGNFQDDYMSSDSTLGLGYT